MALASRNLSLAQWMGDRKQRHREAVVSTHGTARTDVAVAKSLREESSLAGPVKACASCGRHGGATPHGGVLVGSGSHPGTGACVRAVFGLIVLGYAFFGSGRRSTSSSLRCRYVP